ncbi:copper homeostasis protein [Novosphingobium sp. PhB165]|nr:copper homeostasis protein [Novosphingobium sp. PhB165]
MEDAAGIAAAVMGGGDRVELCSALALGGLTPPRSLVRLAAEAPIPVHMLCRPREGDFVYDAWEVAQVRDDIDLAAEAGLAGIVIGAGSAAGLDLPVLDEWLDHARRAGAARGARLSLTLHRVFDLLDDMENGLEQAVAMGFDRILTSGGAVRAAEGARMLAYLGELAAGRIVILAGSGVSAETIPVLGAAGIREFHGSCRTAQAVPDGGERLEQLGFQKGARMVTDAREVARVKAAIEARASGA